MKDGLTQVKELKDKIHEQYIEIQELNKARKTDIEYNKYLQKEIISLNNIIKRLEKELFEMYVDIAGWDEDYAKKLIKKIEDSSQECELLKNNKKDVSIKSDELKCQFSDIWEYGDR